MPRGSKLSDKDMQALRDGATPLETHDRTRMPLRDYSLQHQVTVSRDLNDLAKRDQIFKLTIDDYEVIIDLEELMRFTRWV